MVSAYKYSKLFWFFIVLLGLQFVIWLWFLWNVISIPQGAFQIGYLIGEFLLPFILSQIIGFFLILRRRKVGFWLATLGYLPTGFAWLLFGFGSLLLMVSWIFVFFLTLVLAVFTYRELFSVHETKKQ